MKAILTLLSERTLRWLKETAMNPDETGKRCWVEVGGALRAPRLGAP
jgi:hypothetical protein